MNTIQELAFNFTLFYFLLLKIKMINSKLSKSLKKRSLKLKNKRTKKSKVSRKNVKNMKGGQLTFKEIETIKNTLKEKLERILREKNLDFFINIDIKKKSFKAENLNFYFDIQQNQIIEPLITEELKKHTLIPSEKRHIEEILDLFLLSLFNQFMWSLRDKIQQFTENTTGSSNKGTYSQLPSNENRNRLSN